jgi:hypothetical protein
MLKHIEGSDEKSPICEHILQFGVCFKEEGCSNRHVFSRAFDESLNLPCNGSLKFNLVGIRNPSHFVIEVLEYLPDGQKKWISCKETLDATRTLLKELQAAMTESNIVYNPVRIGDLCAFFSPKKVKWCRGRVVEKE